MIRPANTLDAPRIAPLILLAMGDLAAKFANSSDTSVQLALFERFIALKGNQYSHQNILVWDEGTGVSGMIMAYDGAELDKLRRPFLQYTRSNQGFTGQPEDETQPGELYIDCLAVDPTQQGKGIAKKLLKDLIAKAAALKQPAVGLLVSKGNDKAKQLYEGMGFKVQGEKTLLGGTHYHLQYSL
ncbi:GNAT family N-acetyltransferase [Mucilaginibacter glaciei]|uniref:GNAT family N-acetyltransferase n=1 Tax=Mucilaginibacter glaciei TaxID=2772109 RepID=A0A926NR77_9SPHI|nr:N-acetyltransferase [Mucilaginibacter glaciei]MBD1393230.1 GNAT family N-acetyltransferase [Mucilaginibacter glaciei]